ncbi:MAG: insulinase family protein [bacterium]
MFDPYQNIQKVQLENGIDLYICYWPVNFTRILAQIHCGHVHNPENLEGLAHLAEHVAANSSYLKKVEEKMRLLGICYSTGSTDLLHTWITASIPNGSLKSSHTNHYLRKALNVIDDYFFNIPNFLIEKCFFAEKIAIINECFDRDGSPELLKKTRAISNLPWGELSHLRREYPSTIENISSLDVETFIKNQYTTNNMSIFIVGGLKLDSIMKSINCSKLTRRLSTGERRTPSPTSPLTKPKINHYEFYPEDFGLPSRGQGCVEFILLTTEFSFEVLCLAKLILDRSLTSELRKKRNLSYSANLNTKWRPGNIHEFELQSRIPKDSLNVCEKIIEDTILKSAKDYDMMLKAKKTILSSWRVSSPEIFDTTMGFACDVSKFGKIISEQETKNKYKDTPLEEVANFLKYLAQKENRFTIISYP